MIVAHRPTPTPIYISDDDSGSPSNPINLDDCLPPRRRRRRVCGAGPSGDGGGTLHRPIIIDLDDLDLDDPKGKRPIRALPTVPCTICMDDKRPHDFLSVKNCFHRYCTDCIRHYVTAKLSDNVASIGCPYPGCDHGVLDPEMCREMLPPAVFERWGVVLCESALGAMKFYCPYKDCSAMLVDDGGEGILDAECPHCYRMFCVKCKVPWHTDFTCEEWQNLGEERGGDDLIVMRMAKKHNWQRCPSCSYYVEKTEGCLFVKCRCGTQFCYTCGTKTTRDHFCSKCLPNFGLQPPVMQAHLGQLLPQPLPQPPPPIHQALHLRNLPQPPQVMQQPQQYPQFGQMLQFGTLPQPRQPPPQLPQQQPQLLLPHIRQQLQQQQQQQQQLEQLQQQQRQQQQLQHLRQQLLQLQQHRQQQQQQ